MMSKEEDKPKRSCFRCNGSRTITKTEMDTTMFLLLHVPMMKTTTVRCPQCNGTGKEK